MIEISVHRSKFVHVPHTSLCENTYMEMNFLSLYEGRRWEHRIYRKKPFACPGAPYSAAHLQYLTTASLPDNMFALD